MNNRQLEKRLRQEGFQLARLTKHRVWKHSDGRVIRLSFAPQDNHIKVMKALRPSSRKDS